MEDAKLLDEPARLAALHRYEVLDTPKEASFDRIIGLVKTVLDVPMCSVSLIDANRQWFKSCMGMTDSETARDISFCTHTIKKREPLCIPDAAADERFRDNPFVTGHPYIRSYLGVPLSTPDGYNVGSLCAIDRRPRQFTPEQISVLTTFGALVVDELELRRIAQTDHLTGAASRRSFCNEMEKAIAQYRRNGSKAALVMLDVDHFKRVNDTHGHPAGDLVLQAVSRVLGSQLREADMLGRLGGEEFALLLRDADADSAMETAERFRAAIEDTVVNHDPVIRVTASFGVSALEDGDLSADQWLALADAALYEAKHSGRNRCCAAAAAVVAA